MQQVKERVETRTLAGDAYATILDAIRRGSLPPGQRLRFAELQALCGTSVSPVREALVRLTAEGYTQSDNHRGFRVAPVSAAEMMDIVRNRQLLEGEALRLSILHGDAEWESRVLAAHHLMSRLPRERDDIPSALRDDWEEKHAAFHASLLSACGSPILTGLCGALLARAERYRRMSVSIPGVQRDVVREHREILDATLGRRAEEAVAALREHYQRTADAVRLFFDRQEPG
ncbi:FCD domain-containing protein [Roseomonas gilardii subsp. gilardii]|uniref:GntR family transcriptional regulator n=1 Tax=Roseomonas gilardii TaxID=257708 RepID=UPI001FF798B1|nr:FCD domain-containing protein [Roseomonas gilardii]UPG73887.1 FCD domain-containing protein [Roseomonas gilardii subsp. gilardii]